MCAYTKILHFLLLGGVPCCHVGHALISKANLLRKTVALKLVSQAFGFCSL